MAVVSTSEPDLQRLRQAVDACGEVIFMTDCDGVFTFVNKQFELTYGYSAEQVVGQATPRIIKGGSTTTHRYGEFWRQLRAGETMTERFLNRASDGRYIDIEAVVSPIRSDSGDIVGFLAIQRDITARKRADEELRFQQMVLATEHELTPDGIFVVDDRARVLSLNRRFVEMWGVPQDVLRSADQGILFQAVLARVVNRAQFIQRLKELTAHPDEVAHDEIALIDGRTFERYSAPLHGSEGRYRGRIWYFRDVTERKRSEATLRQERDRAQRYLDIVEVMLLVIDRDGRVQLLNRKGCAILGWDEADLIGRDWIETCLFEPLREKARLRLREVQPGQRWTAETPVMTHAGEERLIRWHTTTITNDTGAVVGLISSGTDITERAKAIDALAIAEERMRFALQNANLGIWDMDCLTGTVRWSEILEAQNGLTPGTFGGTLDCVMECIHPDDRQVVTDAIEASARDGSDFKIEYRCIWPNGSVHWLSTAGRMHLSDTGRAVRGVGIVSDITDRKKLEVELRHAQKLESVGRLASGVAHEINTPVQFVSDSIHFVQDGMADIAALIPKYQALVDLVRQHGPAADTAQAAEAAARGEEDADLEYVLANVPQALTRSLDGLSRVATIVRSMKEFAHPDRSEMTAVDINRALESTLTISRNEYKYVADVETDFGTLPAVMCHAGDVNQAFLNIIVNAAHAIADRMKTDQGLAKGHIRISTRQEGDDAVVRIADDGCGIPDRIRDMIFDPFFTTKDVGRGTGQGLSIARGVIVDKHGGNLLFDTTPGQGTTFEIRLPIQPQKSAH